MDYRKELDRILADLREVYWAMIDNQEDAKVVKRVDTIVGKILKVQSILDGEVK